MTMQSLSDDMLVRRYKTTGDQQAFDELKRRYKGLVFKQLGRWSRAQIPTEAQEAEMWLLFAEALRDYKPGRAGLSTHLSLRLRRQERFTRRYQNSARISEQNAAHIGNIDRAHSQLVDQLGREPTERELAKKTGLGVKKVRTIQRQRRGDLFEGLFEVPQHAANASEDRIQHLIEEFAEELEGRELMAYKLITGAGNTPIVRSKGAVAARLGISQSSLSHILKSISDKLAPHLRRAQTIQD